MALFSTIIGLALASVLLPYFNLLSSKEYIWQDLFSLRWIVIYISLPLGLGLLAGLYPAFYISSFKAISVLKGKEGGAFSKDHLRSSLVIFQFAISIILILATIVVFQQLQFIQNKNIGFNKEQVLIIEGTGSNALGSQTDAFRREVEKLPGVVLSSYARFLPVSQSSRTDLPFFKDANFDIGRSLNMQRWDIDESYIPLLGMEILTGRNFNQKISTDSTALILNEEAVHLLGFGDDPLSHFLYVGTGTTAENITKYSVVGVVKDFNFESLRSKVGPLVFQLGNNKSSTAFKLESANIPNLLTEIESKWYAMANGAPFQYRFLDQAFDSMYRLEQRVGRIALIFSIIAIFIACLGLFGLATFITEQRIKEIGIRKVLGASTGLIVSMLSSYFVKLVAIAAVISLPVGYFLINRWLQDFAYRIHIAWWVIAIAGILALVIALVTVSFQSIRAALANPVNSLRTE
jgi:putative ABC transport system permease protein